MIDSERMEKVSSTYEKMFDQNQQARPSQDSTQMQSSFMDIPFEKKQHTRADSPNDFPQNADPTVDQPVSNDMQYSANVYTKEQR